MHNISCLSPPTTLIIIENLPRQICFFKPGRFSGQVWATRQIFCLGRFLLCYRHYAYIHIYTCIFTLTGDGSKVQRGGRCCPLGYLLFCAPHRRYSSSVSSLIACPPCCTNLGHPHESANRRRESEMTSIFRLYIMKRQARPEQGRFSWADFGMAEEADFLLPLKNPGRFQKLGRFSMIITVSN